RRRAMLRGLLAQNSDGQRAIERGSGAFAGDIAEGKCKLPLPIGNEVVEVAAKFACGSVTGGQVDTGNSACAGGQKLALNFASGIEVAQETLLVFARFQIQAAVLKGN